MLKIHNKTTVEAMLEYAEETLGVKLDGTKERKALIEEIRSLEKEAGITTDESDSPKADTKAPAKGKSRPEKVIIRIHQPPAPDEESEPDSHCIIGLNGRNYQLKYDEEITVPYGVYDILNNMKQTKYFTKKNKETGQTETHTKIVQRYPFSYIGPAE